MSIVENRIGLAGSSSPIVQLGQSDAATSVEAVGVETQHSQLSVMPQEWPANPKGTIEVSDGNGGRETITYTEWHSRLGVNNRAGT